MTMTLDMLDERVSALEDGDLIAGTIESLSRAGVSTSFNFGAATLITLTSTGITPPPNARDLFRVTQSGWIIIQAGAAHTLTFGIDMPAPASAAPGAIGTIALASSGEFRYYHIDANVLVSAAGSAGSLSLDSRLTISVFATVDGNGHPLPAAVAANFPILRVTDLYSGLDLRAPTLNVMAALDALDANAVVVPTAHYVERIISRGI